MPNAQCPILLYERLRPKRSYAAGFTTYLGSGSIERSRDARHESLSTSAQCPMPNVQCPSSSWYVNTKPPLPFQQRLSAFNKFSASFQLGLIWMTMKLLINVAQLGYKEFRADRCKSG
jgi:hypothetical protein